MVAYRRSLRGGIARRSKTRVYCVVSTILCTNSRKKLSLIERLHSVVGTASRQLLMEQTNHRLCIQGVGSSPAVSRILLGYSSFDVAIVYCTEVPASAAGPIWSRLSSGQLEKSGLRQRAALRLDLGGNIRDKKPPIFLSDHRHFLHEAWSYSDIWYAFRLRRYGPPGEGCSRSTGWGFQAQRAKRAQGKVGSRG